MCLNEENTAAGRQQVAKKLLETKLKLLTSGQNVIIEVPKVDGISFLDSQNVVGSILEIKNIGYGRCREEFGRNLRN